MMLSCSAAHANAEAAYMISPQLQGRLAPPQHSPARDRRVCAMHSRFGIPISVKGSCVRQRSYSYHRHLYAISGFRTLVTRLPFRAVVGSTDRFAPHHESNRPSWKGRFRDIQPLCCQLQWCERGTGTPGEQPTLLRHRKPLSHGGAP